MYIHPFVEGCSVPTTDFCSLTHHWLLKVAPTAFPRIFPMIINSSLNHYPPPFISIIIHWSSFMIIDQVIFSTFLNALHSHPFST